MTTTISVRLDDETKKDVDLLVEKLGMSVSTFFGIYAKQAVREQGIPFKVSAANTEREIPDYGAPEHLSFSSLNDPRLVQMVLESIENTREEDYIPVDEAFAQILGREPVQ